MHFHQTTGRRSRVLVVDDEITIAETLSAILKRQGYETATAYNGESAVEIAGSFHPDVLLSDIKMPGMNGVEAAQAIVQAQPQCSVVFISGHAFASDVISASNLPTLSFDVCYKPIAPAVLLQKISEILGAKP